MSVLNIIISNTADVRYTIRSFVRSGRHPARGAARRRAAAVHPRAGEGPAHQCHHDKTRLRRSGAGGLHRHVSGKGSYVAERNPELLRESRLGIVEDKLADAVVTAKTLEIGRADVFRLLELLYERMRHELRA